MPGPSAAPDPLPYALASLLRGAIDSFALVPRFGAVLFARHDIELHSLGPDALVPLPSWLAALGEVERDVGRATLTTMGTNAARLLSIPSSVRTIDDALTALPSAWAALHRGPVGSLSISAPRDEGRVATSTMRYPAAYLTGLLEGVCARKLEVPHRTTVLARATDWLITRRS